MTERLLSCLGASGALAAHVDTSDPRPLESLGRFDFTNLRLGIAAAAELVRTMRRRPDATVLVPISQGRWGFLRDAVFLCLARLMGRPRIVHLHGARFRAFRAESGALVRLAIRFSLRGAEGWVLTPSLCGIFEELILPASVRVLENAVEEPVVDAPASSELPAGPDRGMRILFLSGLYRDKGALELLAAVLAARRRGALEGVSVRMVGSAVIADVYERIERSASQARELGVDVSLVGPVLGAAKGDEYLNADVFVHPTLNDGQPLVLLEAMAAGLPIVATSVGGIPDTVENLRSALLVEPGDVDALAAALERMADDPRLREELGRGARERYLERYTPADFCRRLDSLVATPAPSDVSGGPS